MQSKKELQLWVCTTTTVKVSATDKHFDLFHSEAM